MNVKDVKKAKRYSIVMVRLKYRNLIEKEILEAADEGKNSVQVGLSATEDEDYDNEFINPLLDYLEENDFEYVVDFYGPSKEDKHGTWILNISWE